jgi:hypothetical protein
VDPYAWDYGTIYGWQSINSSLSLLQAGFAGLYALIESPPESLLESLLESLVEGLIESLIEKAALERAALQRSALQGE